MPVAFGQVKSTMLMHQRIQYPRIAYVNVFAARVLCIIAGKHPEVTGPLLCGAFGGTERNFVSFLGSCDCSICVCACVLCVCVCVCVCVSPDAFPQ